MAEQMTVALERLAANLINEATTQQAVRMRRALLAAAAPAPGLIRQEALNTLPQAGGLNRWVADAATKVLAAGVGRTATVAIRTRKTGHDLKAVNDGQIRHRVFGVWRSGVPTENVKPGFFTRPIETKIIPAATAGVVAEMRLTAERLTS